MLNVNKRMFREIEANTKSKKYLKSNVFMANQQVLVATSMGGFYYSECGFVYVPSGDIKTALNVECLTGERTGQKVLVRTVKNGEEYNCGGQIIKTENCLSCSKIVRDKKISAEGLQFIADCINERRREEAREKSEKYYKKHGVGILEPSQM